MVQCAPVPHRSLVGSVANLNIHLHCLVLDGVYRRTGGEPVFLQARAPSRDELQGLLDKIIARLLKLLLRLGYLVEEQGMTYLADMDSDDPANGRVHVSHLPWGRAPDRRC